MDGGFLFSYSDIVFAHEHARRVAAATAPVALIVDRRWRDAYEGRTLHPVSEAELARVVGTRRRRDRHARRQAPGRGGRGRRRIHRPGPLRARGRGRAARRLARGARARAGRAVRRRRDAAPGLPPDGLNAVAARGVTLRAGARRRRLARDRHRSRIWRAPSWSSTPGGREHARQRSRPLAAPADAGEWLAAAATELATARRSSRAAPFAPGVTHARRAAGMAWNAVLVNAPDDDDTAAATWTTSSRSRRRPTATRRSPPTSATPPALLRDTPAAPPALITIGKPDMSALEAATAIVDFARGRVGVSAT